jgi:tetratricopeptide (TPR) repeat protein
MSGTSKKKATAMPSMLPNSPTGEMPGVEGSRSLESESRPAGLNDRWLVSGVCVFLAAIIWLVFSQTLGHEFVNYDDEFYVSDNAAVKSGLTLKSISWAMTFRYPYYWQPLGLLSHMLDCQLYGLAPAGHHLTNVLLHATVAVLLFLVLRQMTGALWRSAFVAAVFAIHPLRVESVAWVSERKDVLSGVFFMLTIGAYVRYVRHSWSLARYLAVVLSFAFGLMSKPTLMTLPFVLLLLDYWPLGRVTGDQWRVTGEKTGKPSILNPQISTLLLEKLPLFMLSAASCVQAAIGNSPAFGSNKSLPVILRISNAMTSYVAYIWQMICPVKLAVLYPFPVKGLPLGEVVGAVILLVFISTVLFMLRQRHPCYLVGWLWYLGMLVPMIGFIQAGVQARADRYTYLPQIGLYLLLTWATADLSAGWRHRRVVLGGGSTIILIALIFCARTQTSYWRNSESLWTRVLACTSDNSTGHINLGRALLQKGRVDEAITQYQQALQISPGHAEAHNYLGNVLLQKGRVDEAITQYQQALQIKPDFAEARYYLGNALLLKGNVDEAIAQYQKALQITPDFAEAHYNFGNALLQKGHVDEAITQYQQALQIKPDDAEVHINLGNALLQKGRVDEAITQYQQALQIKPDFAEASYNLGYVLLQKGKADEAMVHLQTALQIKPDYAEARYYLGNALLQKGRVDEAITQYQQTLQIKPDYAEAHNNLGNALLQKGQVDEAIIHYQKALQIKPDNAKAHVNLGSALLQKGRVDEAMVHYQKALQIKPDSPDILNNLAWLLATCPDAHIRDGVQAVKYAGRACELTHYGMAPLVDTLAAAYAEAGRYDEAMAAAQKACALATAAGEPELLEKNQKLLALYRAHQPYHELAGKVVPAAP